MVTHKENKSYEKSSKKNSVNEIFNREFLEGSKPVGREIWNLEPVGREIW